MKNAVVVLAATALVLPLAGVRAQDRVLVDYSNRQFRDAGPTVAAGDRTRVSAALVSVSTDAVKALGKNYVVLGYARGSAGKAGEVDFFLVSKTPPVAAQPFPEGPSQVVVALKGKDAVGTYVVPADRQYARLVGAADIDGDGTSEVLLEGSGFNMGQLIMSVTAVKLEPNGKTRILQTVDEAYADTCDNPAGKKSRTSKTISLRGGKLVETVHAEKCG